MALDEDERVSGEERRIAALAHPVGSRCTVIFEDGETARLSADFRIRHPLVKQCVEALAYFLPPQVAFDIRRELLERTQGLPAVEQDDGKAIWNVFDSILRTILGLPTSSPPSNAFDRLLDEAEGTADSITRRLAARVRDRKRPSSRLSSLPALPFRQPVSLADASSFLLPLHFVAQDCRLSVTRRKDLLKLSPLLIDLATRLGKLDWWDYWLRLMPPEGQTPQQPEGKSSFEVSD
jgi:anaphase-promoting complex subunit 1